MSKPKYIIDTIDHFISGDWGNEEVSSDAPNRVRCIRGADINSANENNNTSIPTRYISDNSKQKKLLSVGNIIVEKSGGSPTQSTGRVAYISDSIINNEDVVCSNFCAAFKVKEEYDPKYIYYYLKYMYNLGVFFNFEGKTSGIKNLQLEQAYGSIPIKDTNLPYQQKIASVLSALDKKIELNNKIIKELETMSKELYDYWFVQFDFPNKDGKPYRTSGGAMIYNPTLKREIPLGWEVRTLSSIANITMGQSPSGESYNENGAGMIFYQGCTDFGRTFPTVRQYTTSPSRIAKEGDILVSVRAPVGKINFANTDCCIGRGLCAMNSKNNSIAYLYQVVCKLESVFNQRNTDGTTFGSITKDDLFSLSVIATNNDLESKYDKIAENNLSKIFTIANENQELTTLRDWLLPMLMNGQVTIQSEQSQSTKSECVTVDLIRPREIPIDAHILGGHIVNRLYGSKGWGRTKLQKALHLAEYICELPINSQAVRQTAGPFDAQMMNTIDMKFKQYRHVRVDRIKDGKKFRYNYTPTPLICEVEQAFENHHADKKVMLDALLDKLKTMDLDRAEIVSTLYAVWNNRLIKGELISDELLFEDFYDWSSHKSKFSLDLVQRALNYMRREDIVPVGWGRYIDKM